MKKENPNYLVFLRYTGDSPKKSWGTEYAYGLPILLSPPPEGSESGSLGRIGVSGIYHPDEAVMHVLAFLGKANMLPKSVVPIKSLFSILQKWGIDEVQVAEVVNRALLTSYLTSHDPVILIPDRGDEDSNYPERGVLMNTSNKRRVTIPGILFNKTIKTTKGEVEDGKDKE